jgi:hypothetical protein
MGGRATLVHQSLRFCGSDTRYSSNAKPSSEAVGCGFNVRDLFVASYQAGNTQVRSLMVSMFEMLRLTT